LEELVGELGSFSKNNENWQAINEKVRKYSEKDTLTLIVSTSDLKHKGDCIHFDSEGQRKLGKRFAEKFATLQK
jgi:hypothetical protein